MKVIIEGRVHTHHTIIHTLSAVRKISLHAESADAERDHRYYLTDESERVLTAILTSDVGSDVRQQLLDQNDAAEDEMFAATVVGSPDEDLAPGMVLIDFGPVAVEVNAEELTRALRPFVE